MPKRFYLATRKDRSEQAAPLPRALETHGWERTYAWDGRDDVRTENYAAVALKEVNGVRG
jgi:hypothetical protein